MKNTIKLLVHKLPQVSKARSGVVRITPEAETVIHQLQRETGLSACYIASQLIIQGSDITEVIVCD